MDFVVLKLMMLSKNEISADYMYIENTCNLASLQIPNGYHKVFQGFKSTDLLEISKVFEP